MKKYDIYGIGNALVDTEYEVDQLLCLYVDVRYRSEVYEIIDRVLILEFEYLTRMQFDILGLIFDGLRIHTYYRVGGKLVAVALSIELFVYVVLKSGYPLGQAVPTPAIPLLAYGNYGVW
mgnify:CR=1 FL=1